jgi:hypothetical protein
MSSNQKMQETIVQLYQINTKCAFSVNVVYGFLRALRKRDVQTKIKSYTIKKRMTLTIYTYNRSSDIVPTKSSDTIAVAGYGCKANPVAVDKWLMINNIINISHIEMAQK